MKKTNYLLLMLFVLPVIYKMLTDPQPVSLNIIGLVSIIVLIIIFFELMDRTRSFRTKKWTVIKGSKIKNAFLFALVFGLPVSLLLSLILSNKSNFIEAVLFIIIPVTLMFAWIGANEWSRCYKLFLEKKYFTKL